MMSPASRAPPKALMPKGMTKKVKGYGLSHEVGTHERGDERGNKTRTDHFTQKGSSLFFCAGKEHSCKVRPDDASWKSQKGAGPQ